MLRAVRILIDYRPALVARSGVGEYVHELARALAALPPPADGPDCVTLFSSSWAHRVDRTGLDALSVLDRQVPVRVLNYAWHRWEWPPVELLTRTPVDVAHSLHPLLMPARHAAQVVTVHDLDFLRHPERTRAEIRRDYGPLAADHVRRADHVIVNSRFTAEEVTGTFGVPEDRLTVCSPGAPPWPARTSPAQGGTILFLGTLEPRKNVGALLDAYAALLSRRSEVPDLVLAGQPTQAASPWLARLDSPPLAGRVRVLGYLPPQNRRTVFESTALLVIPSFHEGFGMPALEAMAAGVPVVASARGALPEVLGDAGLLVEPTADALAAGIERVLTRPDVAQTMIDRGVERARDYSWHASAVAARTAYRKAVERRRARVHG